MRKILVVPVVIVLAVGGYFGCQMLLQSSAERFLVWAQASLPPGSTLTHAKPEVNLLGRELVLSGVHANLPGPLGYTLDVARIRVQGLPWFWNSTLTFGHFELEGASYSAHGSAYSVESINITAPGFNRAGVRLPQDVSFAALTLKNLLASRTSQGASVKVVGLEAGRYQNGILSSLAATQYEGAGLGQLGMPMTTRIASLKANDLDLKMVLDPTGNIDYVEPLTSYGLSALELSGLSIGDGQADGVTLAHLKVTGAGLPDGTRTALDVTGDQLVMTAKAMSPNEQAYYKELGYEQLSVNFNLTAQFEPQGKILNVKTFKADATDMGSFELSFALGNLPSFKSLATDPNSAKLLLPAVTFNGLEVKILDKGFLKRQVAFGARQMQVEPGVYVEQIIGSLRPMAGATGPGAVRIGQLYRAVSSFLLNPGEFTVSAQPAQPVVLMRFLMGIRGLPAIAEAVNLSASHRQISP